MRFLITLRLGYTYAHPVSHARHVLRLMPRTLAGMQRLILGRLDVEPRPDFESLHEDFFGNAAQTLQYAGEHAAIEMTLHAHVERQFLAPGLNFAAPLARLSAEIASLQDLGPQSPLHFLAASPRIPDVAPFRDFARGAIDPGMSALEAMHAIAAAIHARMTFDDTATDVDTLPLEAFRQQRGVCQDYAHVMIACLRSVGIPAAYVSGFLRTTPPPGRERLAGADAMHAWVRAWCGIDAGWHEFDPTNALEVGDDHVLVAVGRDYGDVAPIRGVSRTAGGQSGHHSVDVVPLP